jgi:uncharacterized protein YkwD
MSFFDRVRHWFVPSSHNAYRPHLLRRTSLGLLLALTLFSEATLLTTLLLREGGGEYFAAVIQSEIVSLTNAERAQSRVGALIENKRLNASAQAKAEHMAALGYFAHDGPDGKKPWSWIEEAGYDYRYAGENLAVRFVDSREVVVAWMASPTHRANIVKPVYQEIGVGVAHGMYKGSPATFVVQHFASPQRTAVLPARVLGSEVGPSPSLSDSIARQFGKFAAEPRESTAWVLGGVVAILLLALAFTFVHHMQIQSRDLLLPGGVVAGIALALMALNAGHLGVSVVDGQAAGVAASGGVVLTTDAASVER